MRAVFYSPMATPDAQAASGAARMSALLAQALDAAGFDVARPKLPRTYDGKGDADTQRAARAASAKAANELLQAFRDAPQTKPDLWFSYHVYYKSPDWIGPAVAQALGIPYVIAEGSHAPKRAGGRWALGHDGATAALSAAERVFAMTEFDRFCLDPLAPGRVRDLKPFIDVTGLPTAQQAAREPVHLITVAMMRNERKRASYAQLAGALQLLNDLPLKLTIAGDGPFREAVAAMFAERAANHRVDFAGALPPARIPALLASGDVFAWPGLGEAYGLAFLEAQAVGLPVAACRDRGVPDAMRDGQTALLSPPEDVAGFAANLRRLATDATLREDFGTRARKFVRDERSVEAAASTLVHVLAGLGL